MRITERKRAVATSPNDLITIEDLEALGLDLTLKSDQEKAQAWITYVSNYLILVARNNGVNLRLKILQDDQLGGTYSSVVKMVVCNAVLRANATNVEIPDATQYAQTATPYSESISYGSAATKEAFFKQKELQLLGFNDVGGKPQFSVLRGVRG